MSDNIDSLWECVVSGSKFFRWTQTDMESILLLCPLFFILLSLHVIGWHAGHSLTRPSSECIKWLMEMIVAGFSLSKIIIHEERSFFVFWCCLYVWVAREPNDSRISRVWNVSYSITIHLLIVIFLGWIFYDADESKSSISVQIQNLTELKHENWWEMYVLCFIQLDK